jgi:hypothetical protein
MPIIIYYNMRATRANYKKEDKDSNDNEGLHLAQHLSGKQG